jgi:hypothetical protein
VLTVYAMLSIALLLASTPLGQAVYDRHLLPLVPLVAAFVLTAGELRLPARRRFALWAGVALGLFALFGLVFTTSSAVLDHTRWHAASELVDAGYDPLTIDGGLDWVGFHSAEPLRRNATSDPQESWWSSGYRDFRPCVVVMNGDSLPTAAYGAEPIRTWFTQLPFGGHVVVHAFQRTDCPAAARR